MTEVPVQPQSQPTKQGISWKNILIGAVIGAVLVGVGVLVFYLYQSSSEEITPTTTPKTSTPSAKTSTPSAKKDETADWKTFNDGEFTFKYPKDWLTEDLSPNKDMHQIRVKTTDGKVSIFFATNFIGDTGSGPNTTLLKEAGVSVNGKIYDSREIIDDDYGDWYLYRLGRDFSFIASSETVPSTEQRNLIKTILKNFKRL